MINYLCSSDACSINLGSTVILTGGVYFQHRVSEYSETGYQRELPKLMTGRFNHGCSYFENEEGTKVNIETNSCGVIIFQTLLVTGGRKISSTELLVEYSAKWIYSGELPTKRYALRGANIDQRVMMTGMK